MMLDIELVFTYEKISPAEIWEILLSSLQLYCDLNVQSCKLYNSTLPVNHVKKALLSNKRSHFNIDFNTYNFRYGAIANNNLSFLKIVINLDDISCVLSLIQLFSTLKPFVMGRLNSESYEFWQNAYDPLQYEVRNRSYENLPMKLNGLPSPLTRIIIDTSQNPGRRVLRNGYIEAIGSTMWLGKSFWELTEASKETVQRTPWLESTELPNDVLQIKVRNQPFTSAEGCQGELQTKLRQLLFSKNPQND